ncbi:hypothetical protein [Streptomyces sp. NBC_00154]|nr:hypothetical protein [Streptomyces sp. NBC_00154]MCX5317317.1 hypothetical protein [Streptomyces sp. NBC_00154]
MNRPIPTAGKNRLAKGARPEEETATAMVRRKEIAMAEGAAGM